MGGLCWLSSQAYAAGGHHAVDDAAIVAPGQCEVETWVDRERHGARTLVHAGPACRLGPVEVGLNLDRVHFAGEGSVTVGGPQLKWAQQVTEHIGVGAVLGLSWRDRTPRSVSSMLLIPLTWQASETVAVHLNIGKDFRPGTEPDTLRTGAALEWAPSTTWSFVAERMRESNTNHWRVGTRYELTERINIDLSRAQGLDSRLPAWWTLGVTWAFAQ